MKNWVNNNILMSKLLNRPNEALLSWKYVNHVNFWVMYYCRTKTTHFLNELNKSWPYQSNTTYFIKRVTGSCQPVIKQIKLGLRNFDTNLKCVIFMLIHKVEYSYLVPQHDTAQTQPAVNCYSTFNAQIMDTCAFINAYCVLQINDKRHSSLQKNFVHMLPRFLQLIIKHPINRA